MHRIGFGSFGIVATTLALVTLLAVAQDGGGGAEVDAALLAQGEEIFAARCAICHGATGQGDPTRFPALAGNDALRDPSLIVNNIHEGREAMPAFPQF